MTKEFAQIKNILSANEEAAKKIQLQKDNEYKLAQQKRDEEERQKQAEFDKQVETEMTALKNSGIISLFKEIIDGGILPITNQKETPVYKTNFWGRKTNEVDRYIKSYDGYTCPPEIIINKPKFCNYNSSINFNTEVSVDLIFNGYSSWHYANGDRVEQGINGFKHCDYIHASIKDNLLKINNIPVEEGGLINSLTNGIEEPLHYKAPADEWHSDGH